MLNGDLQLFRRGPVDQFPPYVFWERDSPFMDYDDPQLYNLWIMLVHKLWWFIMVHKILINNHKPQWFTMIME